MPLRRILTIANVLATMLLASACHYYGYSGFRHHGGYYPGNHGLHHGGHRIRLHGGFRRGYHGDYRSRHHGGYRYW